MFDVQKLLNLSGLQSRLMYLNTYKNNTLNATSIFSRFLGGAFDFVSLYTRIYALEDSFYPGRP